VLLVKHRHLVNILLTAAIAISVAAPAARATPRADGVGQPRWVAVAVATLWSSPQSPRPVDAAALTNPVDEPTWLKRMTLSQRYGLYNRVVTQAIYGTALTVLDTQGTWTKVAVLNQPSQHHPLGYPGWVPTAQLTDKAPAAGAVPVIVAQPTAKVFSDAARTQPALTLSYGTVLAAAVAPSSANGSLAVAGLGGVTWYIDPAAVAVRAAAPAAPTGEQLVAEARRFLRLAYLWGGNAGWGFDCSGLVQAAYARFGVTIPRDATPQFNFASATRVTRAELRKGDLVFFRTRAGTIHHVGMYVGSGRFIHSPRTGSRVQISALGAQPYAREFAGGRRYVG
jgi:cell wall-associated NlpC family hydrolase